MKNVKRLGITLLFLATSLIFSGCVTVENGRRVPNPRKAATAYAALAAQYIKQNNLDAAKVNAEKAIKLDSDFAPAYNMMALILQREGSANNLRKAEGYFEKAIDKQENYAQAHNNFGVYLSQMKRYEEAMKEFEIAGSTLGYNGRVAAFENLGRVALQAKDDERAEKAFRQALSVNPNSFISKIELVDLLMKQQKYEQAQPIYQDYVNFLGNRSQGSRSLLQGILLSHALHDRTEFARLTSLLKDNYPNSVEAQKYRKLFPSE